MKASEIVEDAIRAKGILKKEAAGLIEMHPNTLVRKLSENRMKAQEFIDLLERLGYTVSLVDTKENTELKARRRGSGPRVRRMIDGVFYDTRNADAVCRTEIENGWYIELYQDDDGRYFAVHYSTWEGTGPFITCCPREEAEKLRKQYA